MADYIRPTPRNPILGLLADALTGGVDWMRDPRRAQQMQGLGGLLAETGIPATVERLSYGEPLTTGRGMTTRLRPEAEAALLTLSPAPQATSRAAMAAGRAGERMAERVVPQIMERGGMPAGLLQDLAQGSRSQITPQISQQMARAPQEEALRLAQQRAALPVEQGGLGLPAGNTPEMRSAAMGFQDFYHGTERLDRLLEKKSLDPRRATSGPMPYGTSERQLASSYAMSKADTSRRAMDEGDAKNYFQVSPKDIGSSGRTPIPVENVWYYLNQQEREKIMNLAPRVGYENLDEFTGKFIVHPEGVNATLSPSQWNWFMKNEAKGNPLTALRNMWYESGQLVNEPEKLAEIFRLAGVKAPISQTNAPWTEAKGVLLGKASLTNPIDTSNTEQVLSIIEPLKKAFEKDRSRTKVGPDQWGKESRYTPKQWVNELEKDLKSGNESYVWTSIPDKVTNELRRLGFNGIIDQSGKGGGAKSPVLIPFEPSQVRSRFAAFDPFRLTPAIAATMGVAAPDLLARTIDDEERREQLLPGLLAP